MKVINDVIVEMACFSLYAWCEKPQRDKQCHQDSDFNIIFLLHSLLILHTVT